ncbi:DnaJ like chaperone protein [Thiohalospira halophila DSM 15071]|uniref:DnaJ like chaperone protein n=1 Tax=Thiohalospira halophila DSM 15071 TaxID=1123397 RepID=A0A1I1Q819_9GAMM|nr:TerB family tellurite resistance protein [Thiohalospira halophila]SFD14260.1 DnaJ like chaperone protein [Thiohalospira halophila DSM 15071]
MFGWRRLAPSGIGEAGEGIDPAGLFHPDEGPRVRRTFFTALFAVAGHLAKSDGPVQEAEIDAARRIMRRLELNDAETQAARALFQHGKSAEYPVERALRRLGRDCARRALLDRFLDWQMEVALADSGIVHAERALFDTMAELLGYSRYDIRRVEDSVGTRLRPLPENGGERALAVLGLGADADLATIRRSYRQLLSRHHPDRVTARGGTDEEVRAAAEYTRELRAAYEALAEQREAGVVARAGEGP